MWNIQLPDINELSESDKNLVEMKSMIDFVKSPNTKWADFVRTPEYQDFYHRHPEYDAIVYTNFLIERNNYGNRSGNTRNGSKEEQRIGILCQNVVSRYLWSYDPNRTAQTKQAVMDKSGFDGGHDYLINGCKVDIKTSGRNVNLNLEFAHNLAWRQVSLDCDFYIWASYNKRDNIIQVSGVTPKAIISKLGKYIRPGNVSVNNQGKIIESLDGRLEIADYCLNSNVNSVSDIYKLINEKNKITEDNVLYGSKTAKLISEIEAADKGDKEAQRALNEYKRTCINSQVNKYTISDYKLDFYSSKMSLEEKTEKYQLMLGTLNKIKKDYVKVYNGKEWHKIEKEPCSL